MLSLKMIEFYAYIRAVRTLYSMFVLNDDDVKIIIIALACSTYVLGSAHTVPDGEKIGQPFVLSESRLVLANN